MSIETVIATLEHFKKRPLMYVHTNNLDSVSNFLSGYLTCYAQSNSEISNNTFSDWVSRMGQKTSLAWPSHIYRVLANENSEKAYELTFNLLLEFLNSHKAKNN